MTIDYVGRALGRPSVVNVVSVVWPTLDEAAYHGLAGEIVRTIEPHTEADSAALLIQVLTFFGNIIGHSPHYCVEADNHHANLFAVLVGETSKGRKGTSGGRALSVMMHVDERWCDDRLKGGLSTGEGLINEVRDPVQKWDTKEKRFETVDPGITDKRLMVVEPEFGNALAVMERPGNILSPVIRKAWDGHVLSTLTKNSPLKATGAHISIVGHITAAELRSSLTRTDAANGFGNRFLFMCVRRSKFLPFGGALEEAEISALGERLKPVANDAMLAGRVTMTVAARAVWERLYEPLSAEQPGLLGAICARAEAQTIRLALIYALLDRSAEIDVAHLNAALAVWTYAEASAAHIFGNLLGDPVADEIHRAFMQASPEGMTRTAIRDLFGRNRSGDRIGAALQLLVSKGRACSETRITGGRPLEVWRATR